MDVDQIKRIAKHAEDVSICSGRGLRNFRIRQGLRFAVVSFPPGVSYVFCREEGWVLEAFEVKWITWIFVHCLPDFAESMVWETHVQIYTFGVVFWRFGIVSFLSGHRWNVR